MPCKGDHPLRILKKIFKFIAIHVILVINTYNAIKDNHVTSIVHVLKIQSVFDNGIYMKLYNVYAFMQGCNTVYIFNIVYCYNDVIIIFCEIYVFPAIDVLLKITV